MLFFSIIPAADAGGVGHLVHAEVDGVGVVLARFPAGVEGFDDVGLWDPAGVAAADLVGDFEGGGADLRDRIEFIADVVGVAGDDACAVVVCLGCVVDGVGEIGVADRPAIAGADVEVAFGCESLHYHALDSH